MSWLDHEWFTLRVDTPEFWVTSDDSDTERNYPPCTYGRTFRLLSSPIYIEKLAHEVARFKDWILTQPNAVPPVEFWVWTASPFTPTTKETTT